MPRPPMFGGVWVSYRPGPENIKVVENSRLRMEIDPAGVKSLFDKKSGQFVINARKEHAPLFRLFCKMPGRVDFPETCDLGAPWWTAFTWPARPRNATRDHASLAQ